MPDIALPLDRPIILLGGGGHARVLLDLLGLLNATILGVTTKDGNREQLTPDVAVLGADDVVTQHAPADILLVNGLGFTKASDWRKRTQEKFAALGYRFPTLIHPSAIVSRFAALREGCQIMAGAVVQTGARIGTGAIVNTRASVDHDCVIGAYAHIAPGCTLSGGVQVGTCSLIGVGAAVIQNVRIGAMTTIGAGAAVIGDIADNACVGGVPSRPLGSTLKND